MTLGTTGTVANKVYDGTAAATVATNGTLAGIIGTDAVTLSLTGATFANANAGVAKAVTGTYALSGASAGNYSLAGTAFSGTASITPATLTLAAAATVAASKVYDGTTGIQILTTGSLAGVIGSDAVTLGLTAQYGDAHAGASKSVTGAYALSGASAGNYSLGAASAFSGTAAILRRR